MTLNLEIERTTPLAPREMAIDLLPLAESDRDTARCASCSRVEAICCAERHNGQFVNARCARCCRH